MKKLLASVCLLAMFVVVPTYAQNADPLKDITILKRPEDFPSALKLAIQNRIERITMLQGSLACVQQATNMDDIRACQAEEGNNIAKIRLEYCDTTISWPIAQPKNKNNAVAASPELNECQRAMLALTGSNNPPEDQGKAH